MAIEEIFETPFSWRPMHTAPRDQLVLLLFKSTSRIEDGVNYIQGQKMAFAKLSRNEAGRLTWYLNIDPYLVGGGPVTQPVLTRTPDAWCHPPHVAEAN